MLYKCCCLLLAVDELVHFIFFFYFLNIIIIVRCRVAVIARPNKLDYAMIMTTTMVSMGKV